MKVKVGFMVCGVHEKAKDSLGRPMIDLHLVEKAFEALRDLGFEIYKVEGVLSRFHQFEDAFKECKAQNVDCIIVYVATWLWASEVWRAAKMVSKPIIVWCAPTPIGWPTGGALVLHGALDEIGVKHLLVYGYPRDEDTMGRILSFARAVAVVNRLRKSRLGIIGGYGMGAVTGVVDIAQVLSKFGIQVEHIDQYELVVRAERFSKDEVEALYSMLKNVLEKYLSST